MSSNNRFLPDSFKETFEARLDDFKYILKHTCVDMESLNEFISSINEDDVIEILEPNFIQYWRSLNYFNYCSYTPEELFFSSFNKLFDREQWIVDSLVFEFKYVLDSKSTNYDFSTPAHIAKESIGNENIFEVTYKKAACLMHPNNKIFGIAVTSQFSKQILNLCK